MSHSSTSSSKSPWRFAARTALFLSPILLVLGVMEYAFYTSGESWTAGKILATQAKEPDAIYGRRIFGQNFNIFKTHGMRRHKPKIVTVGSSRVLQFRREMFAPISDQFYNCGSLIQRPGDLLAFFAMLAEEKLPRPELVIVGMDPWWLGEGVDTTATWLTDPLIEYKLFPVKEHVHAWRDTLKRPQQLRQAFQVNRSPHYGRPAYGLRSMIYGGGYREDGSMLYEDMLVDYLREPGFRDRERPATRDRIAKGMMQFKAKTGVDQAVVAQIISAMNAAQAKGTEVIVFLPPFSEESTALLDQQDGLRTWWRAYRDDLPNQLNAAGIFCMPYATSSGLDLTDHYMIDGLHPSEVWIARYLERLIDSAPATSRLKQVDSEALKALSRGPKVMPLAFEPMEGIELQPGVSPFK